MTGFEVLLKERKVEIKYKTDRWFIVYSASVDKAFFTHNCGRSWPWLQLPRDHKFKCDSCNAQAPNDIVTLFLLGDDNVFIR